MIGFLDNGFGWDQAGNELEKQPKSSEKEGYQDKVQRWTEEYGFDAALGLAVGIAGPEYALAYAASETGMAAGEAAAEAGEQIYNKMSGIYDAEVSSKQGPFSD